MLGWISPVQSSLLPPNHTPDARGREQVRGGLPEEPCARGPQQPAEDAGDLGVTGATATPTEKGPQGKGGTQSALRYKHPW